MTNLDALASMKYSGRSIIAGMTSAGDLYIAYSLTGRSPASQARELLEGEKTKTILAAVTDRTVLEQGSPALLLYPAVVPVKDVLVATNGAQTKLVYSAVHRKLDKLDKVDPLDILGDAFKEPVFEYDEKEDRWIDLTTFEPDAPNFTPRINVCAFNGWANFHIVWHENGEKRQAFYPYELKPGHGKLLATYQGGNEKPLQPFTGAPRDVTITEQSATSIAEVVYAALRSGQENHRVSTAVALIRMPAQTLETALINRSQRGE